MEVVDEVVCACINKGKCSSWGGAARGYGIAYV